MADESQVVVVTGAAGNLGRAACAVLAGRGARVVTIDRAAAPLHDLVAGLPGAAGHLALPEVDLLDAAACDRAIAATLARYGRVDGVAHTVGGFAAAGFVEAGAAAWESMFRINVLSTVNLFRAALPPMRARGQGSLLAIGAMAALRAPGGMAAYAASKSAVLRLVESLAEEVKGEGIRVNAILPGTIDTPPNRAAMPDADTTRWVQPAQLAEVIAFLLSPAASGVTGALVPVTGRG